MLAFIVLIIAGDILIFMPGQEEIEVTCDVIKGIAILSFVLFCVISNYMHL